MYGVSGRDVFLVEDLGQQRLPARTLTAVLRRAGLSVRLVHCGPGDDPEALVALARSEQPRLIVLSILFAHLLAENLALATRLRAAGVTAHVTMAGPLPTLAYADLLAACPALDSVLCGEAEASVVQLARSLPDPADWQAVPGLAHCSPAVHANPPSQLPLDLDDLPFPVWDDGIPTCLGLGFATVEGSRGCYHACAFCLPCAFYRTVIAAPYRLRSIPSLVDEIEALYRLGTRLFLFDDEQFLPPGQARTERVQALGDQLKQRGLDIAFTIKCRADDIDEALFRQLKAMGLVRVYVGIESGCQASLDLFGKQVTIARNAQALALLDALDIVADFHSLLFHPWSTLEMVRAEFEFLEQVLPHTPTPFTFHEVGCYPGTPLAGRMRDQEGVGPLTYTIAAPGAELLRRLSRVVFRARDAEPGLHGQITQAWYDVLLLRRFRPERFSMRQPRALRDIVFHLNRESLIVWREMLSYVAAGDLHDAGRVNECASAWASRINILDMQSGQQLSELMRE